MKYIIDYSDGRYYVKCDEHDQQFTAWSEHYGVMELSAEEDVRFQRYLTEEKFWHDRMRAVDNAFHEDDNWRWTRQW